MDSQQSKKIHKGGEIVRTEPYDMQLINSEPFFKESFQRVGCLNFCQKMQRGHPEVAKQFALNFSGTKTKVGMLEFEVSEHSISVATEIPDCGEKWFKSMSLNSSFSKEFFKPEYQGDNLSKGVPRSHMLEYFDKMLRVIQRYFTCEGRFNMVYQYHIRLLLHFTGKESMNLPFYLFRSIGKMSDRVQAKSKQVDTSVFHSGLIKMLVLEELKKTNTDWENFLAASYFQLDIAPTPQSKRQTPTPVEKIVHSDSSKKRRMTRSDKYFQATDKAEEGGPSQPPDREVSPVAEPTPMEIPSSKTGKLKGKKLVFPHQLLQKKSNLEDLLLDQQPNNMFP
jgi:hypothetical protein